MGDQPSEPTTVGSTTTTSMKVSQVAFGTGQLGGEWGQFDEDEGIAAIRRARGLGVNLFDTAQGYGFGASERRLGRALRDDLDNCRDEVVVAPKAREVEILVDMPQARRVAAAGARSAPSSWWCS